jgi:hypothetical protein
LTPSLIGLSIQTWELCLLFPQAIFEDLFGSSKWHVKIGLLGNTFYQDFKLSLHQWGKSMTAASNGATYMRKCHGDSLICLASHLIKPKWGRSNNCLVTRLSGSSIPSWWFLRHACRACDYSHVCIEQQFYGDGSIFSDKEINL